MTIDFLKRSVSTFLKMTGCLAVPLLFSALSPGCVNDPEKVAEVVVADTLPSEIAENLRMIHSDSALIKALVEAPQMMRYADEDQRLVCPKGVHVTFFRPNGQVESELKAEWAISYEQRKTMEAKRNVVVVNTRGEKLETEHLVWDQRNKRIFTEEFVRITTADEVIFGHGLESNETFTEYRIKNIKGTLNLKDDTRTENS